MADGGRIIEEVQRLDPRRDPFVLAATQTVAFQETELLLRGQVMQRDGKLPAGGHLRHAVLPIDDANDFLAVIEDQILQSQIAMIQVRLAAPMFQLPDLCEKFPEIGGLKELAQDVKPLLEANCLSCHGAEHPKGGLKLTTRSEALTGGESGAALVPGQPGKSPIYAGAILKVHPA